MPEIDFSPENKRSSSESFEFDKLKLKKDERARIVLLEKPTFAFVHTLRAPKILNGKAVKVEKETRRGEKYLDYDMDFIGRPLCLGDYGILADKGEDAANCPACKRSTQSNEVSPPERRFAMNIIRYGMNREQKLIEPFKCDCLVWGFTDKTYNRLIDIADEHGTLLGRDLLLTCTNEPYQNYDIQAGAQSLWQTSEQMKQTVVGTYQSNRVSELERACGRKAETRWMIKDLDTIAERWRAARGEKDGTEAAGAAALDTGLSQLLDNNGTPAQDPIDVGSLLGDSGTGGQADAALPDLPGDAGTSNDTADAENTREPVPAAAAKSGDSFDFSTILDGLK